MKTGLRIGGGVQWTQPCDGGRCRALVAAVTQQQTNRLLLPFVDGGDNVVGLVHALSAGCADAGVVGAAVHLQQTLVLFTDLLLQVESGFN